MQSVYGPEPGEAGACSLTAQSCEPAASTSALGPVRMHVENQDNGNVSSSCNESAEFIKTVEVVVYFSSRSFLSRTRPITWLCTVFLLNVCFLRLF